MRLANGSIDPDNVKRYSEFARAYKNKLIDLCDNNIDVLRLDKQRLSLRGILTVDSKGKISTKVPIPTPSHSDAYNNIVKRISTMSVAYKPVEKMTKKVAEKEIIEKLCGGDMTGGSCASLGLAYAGNKSGLDVTDYRGGDSRLFFCRKSNLDAVAKLVDQDKVYHETARSWGTAGNRLLKKVEKGKEYYFVCGRHAAIVRRTDDGLQYLELQSGYRNGWKDFDGNPRYTLAQRFGCRGSQGYDVDVFMIDIDAFKGNNEFADILGYINTDTDKQRKGERGHER